MELREKKQNRQKAGVNKGKAAAEKKTPITQEKIFKIMLAVTVTIAVVFFFKNLLGGAMKEALFIGASIVVFASVFGVMIVKKATERSKQMAIALGMMILTFIIALNSGAYFSDDFIMFLAVIALTGLYLEPKYSTAQLIVATIALSVMYMLHPEKADPFGQYVQCLGEFVLTGVLFIQTIKRGRAFIEIGEERAKEAEGLVGSIREMGASLETDFEQSSAAIDNNTDALQRGSDSIVISAEGMNESCNNVQGCIVDSQQSIKALNEEVARVEVALKENQSNMENMEKQLATVSTTITEANEVFHAMEKKMGEIAEIADQLATISFNTTILSLNASIEAARAGASGAGFAVVADEMRQLSNTSSGFSEQVSEVVKELIKEVGQTAEQFSGSTEALEESKATMKELQESFDKLNKQFTNLYGNIETQNSSVNQVNVIFDELKARIGEMQSYSDNNQRAVNAIVHTMDMYRDSMERVIENTKI